MSHVPLATHRFAKLSPRGARHRGLRVFTVPSCCRVAAAKKCATGTGVRDYIHVTDLALGHVAALKKLDALALEVSYT